MSLADNFIELFGDSDSGDDDFPGFEDEEIEEVDSEDAAGLEEEERAVENPTDLDWKAVNVSGVGPRGAAESQPDQWLQPFTTDPGPRIDFTAANELDFFGTMFPNEIFSYIVNETNRYANSIFNECVEANKEVPHYLQEWREVTESEMRAFLAILFIMGIDEKPSLKFYWSTHNLFFTPGFSALMSRNRFLLILKFFHVCNNFEQVPQGSPGYHRMFKVNALANLFVNVWKSNFNLGQHISIDEGMIAFKGRVAITQYMPKKPIKWGMKAWILSDSKTAYTFNWKLYAGKDKDKDKDIQISQEVVTDLVHGLENKGHIVYCDNFYSSPTLFLKLIRLGIGACGTVRVNRIGMPEQLKPVKRKQKISKKEPGPFFFRKNKLLTCAWYDRRPVYMLSSIHDSSLIQKRLRAKKKDYPSGFRIVNKPVVIDRYNTYMSGVDKGDQLFTYYGFHRRSLKWWKKIAFHLFEVAMVNSWILYHQTYPDGADSLHYRIKVIEGLLEGYDRKDKPPGRPNTSRPVERPSTDSPLRLVAGRHFPTKIEGGKRPDCRVCSNRDKKRRRQTSAECSDCNTALCPVPCFKIYHTIANYKDYFEKNFAK